MWRRKRALNSLDDDVRDHLDREIEDNVARGMSPEEARRQALVKFGSVALAREDTQRVWTWVWLEQSQQDMRHAWRALRRTPGFSVVAVLTLALGLGTNAALFAAVNAVLLRPLPYSDPGTLVWIESTPVTLGVRSLAAASREGVRSVSDLAGFHGPEMATLVERGTSEQVAAAQVTSNFFSLLGVLPGSGRVFSSADGSPTTPEVAVLSHGYWTQRFGGSSQVLGTNVIVNGAPVTVVGVMAPGFRFPAKRGFSPSGLPVETQPDIVSVIRGEMGLNVIGRLAPGATPEQVAAELLGVHKRDGQSRFGQGLLDRMELIAVPLQQQLVGDVRQRLLLAMGAAVLLLLVACVNVANLLMARASARRSELAVRAALGARTGQLVRLLLAESILLSLVGLAGGLALMVWSLAGIRALLADRLAFIDFLTIDWRVLIFGVVVAVVTGVVSGLLSLPTMRSTSLAAASRESHGLQVPSRTRIRRTLLSAEVAFTFILVVGASLLGQTFWNLSFKDRGFDAEGVLTARVSPNLGADLRQAQTLMPEFFADLTEGLAGLPGVESAAAVSIMPFAGPTFGLSQIIVDRQPPPVDGKASTRVATVTPGYFRTMGIGILAGREFDGRDGLGTDRVAIVNAAFRRRFAPGNDIVGARVTGDAPLVVVGLVDDVPMRSLREITEPMLFIPLAQSPGGPFHWRAMTVVIRAARDDARPLTTLVREQIHAAGPGILVDEIATMDERVSAVMRAERDSAKVFGFFAVAALVLASVGVYGIASYSVLRRMKEIGVRIALGAGRHHVNKMVLAGVLGPTLVGVALGLAGAAGTTPLLASMVYGVAPMEPATLSVAAVTLIGVAVAAAYLPARRAARIDPLVALRID